MRPLVLLLAVCTLSRTAGWAAVPAVARRPPRVAASAPCFQMRVGDDDDDELPDSLFGDDDDGDLGLVKMPMMVTPAQAAFQRFRERQKPSERRGVNGEDDPIARAALGDPDPAAGTKGGNDLGFSLRETIFDMGDDDVIGF